jgi:hypothetical protein
VSRYGIACHEAGHAVAACLLNHEVVAVSIELDGGHAGVVRHRARDPFPDYPRTADFTSLFTAPLDVRCHLERLCAISLAGPATESVYGDDLPLGYHAPDQDETHVREVLERRQTMPEETRALLEEGNGNGETDWERSTKLAGLCATPSPTLAELFYRWIDAEVKEWVLSERFRRPLMRIVPVLLDKGELSGDEIEALVNDTVKEETFAV